MISKIYNVLYFHIQRIVRRIYVSVLKFFGMSDYSRWSKMEALAPRWDERTKILASYIEPNKRVLEFGAGRQALKGFLPDGCTYIHSDIVKRDAHTLVIDLNKELPELPTVDFIIFSGVLEYVRDIEDVLRHCLVYSDTVLFSYATTDTYGDFKNRRLYGWISDASEKDILDISKRLDASFKTLSVWNKQTLYRFSKETRD